jgi:molybdate transport system substrate-binding protein
MLMEMEEPPLGVEEWIVSELTPVIIVPEGKNELLKISGVADLARDDIRLGLTDYEHSTLGRMVGRIFERAGIDFQQLNERKDIFTSRSGGEVASQVQAGTLDAAMVWNAVAHLRRDDVDVVPVGDALPVPYVDTLTSATNKTYHLTPVNVTMATLRTSRMPEVAADFARFVLSSENHDLFSQYGFTPRKAMKVYEDGKKLDEPEPVTGRWSRPNQPLRLYAGAGLRPALDELIPAFRKETGIDVEPDYGGSGIVQARAQESREADLFMPGDVGYVDALERQEPGKVRSRTTVSYFVPVIIKAKGLDKDIRSIEDFFDEDVKVALGRKGVCQVGNVSEKILANYGRSRSELGDIQESGTVNELGNWVKMGTVDAAIVWDAIAANLADDVEVVRIPPEKNVISTVVVALLDSAGQPEAARRFLEFLTGPQARRILQSRGYSVESPADAGN